MSAQPSDRSLSRKKTGNVSPLSGLATPPTDDPPFRYFRLKDIRVEYERVNQKFPMGSAMYFGKVPEHVLPYCSLFSAHVRLRQICDETLHGRTWERHPVLKLSGDRQPIPAVRYEVTGLPEPEVQALQTALKELGFDSKMSEALYLDQYFIYISGKDAVERFSLMIMDDAPVLPTPANSFASSSCPTLAEQESST